MSDFTASNPNRRPTLLNDQHAQDLGASIKFVGLLSAMMGFSALGTAIPIGIAADRIGRRAVLILGSSAYALAMLIFAAAQSPGWLVPGRMLVGIGIIAMLWMAGVSLGDIVAPHERGVCFGLFATAMGIGYGVGPWVGSMIAGPHGYRLSYLVGGIAGWLGVGLVLGVLRPPLLRLPTRSASGPGIRAGLRVARTRAVAVAAAANVAISFSFYTVVLTFLPLRAEEIGLGDAAIAALFTTRALATTLVRLPMGAMTGRIGSRRMLLIALCAEAAVTGAFLLATSSTALLILIALEGITFAGFLTGSQAYIVATTTIESRGAAVGITTTIGGLGNAIAPLALGFAADAFGLRIVFPLAAIGMAAAVAVIVCLWRSMNHDLPLAAR